MFYFTCIEYFEDSHTTLGEYPLWVVIYEENGKVSVLMKYQVECKAI